MKRTIKKLAVGCLLMTAIAAHAVPVTFEFASASPNGYSFSYGSGGAPLDVPANFTDFGFLLASNFAGSFTIETDTPALPGNIFLNGSLVQAGNVYLNPVTQLGLSFGTEQFDFVSSQAPGSSATVRSLASVFDLPTPSSNPTTNYDSYNFSVLFGPGVFQGPYSHLSASFSMVRTERDLGVITSRDMVDNLVFGSGWSSYFSITDPTQPGGQYQVYAPLTSLTRATSVPEPGTAGLFLLAMGLAVLRVGARRKEAATR